MTAAEDARPDVSVVIASWNAKQLLVDCLESLMAVTQPPRLEIIVVDNGSDDGSPEAVAERFPDVTLIRNGANLGFPRANNQGIERARGRYVCLLNSDVVVDPAVFEKLVAYMDGETDVGMVGPRVLNGDSTLQVSCFRLPTPGRELLHALGLERVGRPVGLSKQYDMHAWPLDRPRPVEMLSGCCNMIRRKAIDRVGVMDERLFFYGDDMDYCKRFREHGWRVMYYPLAEIVHFRAGSSRNAPLEFAIEFQKARLKFWEIHYGRLGRAYCRALAFVQESLRLLKRCAAYVVKPSCRDDEREKIRRSYVCLQWLAGVGRIRDAERGLA